MEAAIWQKMCSFVRQTTATRCLQTTPLLPGILNHRQTYTTTQSLTQRHVLQLDVRQLNPDYGPRFPMPGETLIGNDFEMGFGGKAGNGCVAAACLGASPSMIGKVGEDTFGQDYIKNLQDKNINTECVFISKEASTSTANIIVTNNGQNCIVYVPGASGKLTKEDVLASEQVIRNALIFFCTFECSMDVTVQALKMARKHSVRTVVNAAPCDRKVDKEILKLCDVLVVNETEAGFLAEVLVDTVESAKVAVDILTREGCSQVIVTLGASGVVYGSQESHDRIHVSTKKIESVVDTTGAGDAFVGALVYFMSSYASLSMEEMLKRACYIATTSVQKRGTQKSFPQRLDLPPQLFDK